MIEYEYVDEYKDVLTLRSMTTKRGRPAVLVSCNTTEDVSASVIVPTKELPCLIEALQSLYDYDNPPGEDALTRAHAENERLRAALLEIKNVPFQYSIKSGPASAMRNIARAALAGEKKDD